MLQTFPSELLIAIFEYLPVESLIRIDEVYKPWSHLARKLGACRLDITHIDPLNNKERANNDDEKKMISYIKQEIPTFDQGANIRYLLIASHRLVPSSVFLFIQFLFPNIKTFDYDDRLLDVTKPNPIIHIRHSLLPCGGWQHSITHLPACFNGIDILSRDGILCRRLEHLYVGPDIVSMTADPNSGSYRLRLQVLPQLVSLIFHSSFQFDETMLSEIHRQCPRLQSLTLRDTSLFCDSDRGYPFQHEVFFKKPGLKVLKLVNVTFLTYATFHFFPEKYPNIESLTLSINYQKYQKFGSRSNHKSIRECIYEMIVSFKQLSHVTVHLIGFGKKTAKVNVLYPNQLETYFSKFLNKPVQVKVTFS